MHTVYRQTLYTELENTFILLYIHNNSETRTYRVTRKDETVKTTCNSLHLTIPRRKDNQVTWNH